MPEKRTVPCARAEPRDEVDQLLSTVFWKAAEVGEPPGEHGTDPSPLQDLLNRVVQFFETDPQLSLLLRDLPVTFGGGELFATLFQSLVPGPYRAPAGFLIPRPGGKLTRRELEVLRATAKGLTRTEIAFRLGIKEGAVKSHLYHVFQKLGVTNSHDAVNKAILLGIPGLTLGDAVTSLRERYEVDYDHFAYRLMDCVKYGADHKWSTPTTDLARLGLLLFLLAPMGEFHRWTRQNREPSRGAILRFRSDGGLLEVLADDGALRHPLGLAFAPPAAAEHGFTPGHLFVADCRVDPDPLNRDIIVELTPEGIPVRSFTGGPYFQTALVNTNALAFTLAGTLLAPTSMCNAMMEFTEGGGAVCRLFGGVPYGGLAVSRSGEIYSVGGWEIDKRVRVFSMEGQLLGKFGNKKVLHYHGMALDDWGRVYVSDGGGRSVEVYDRKSMKAYDPESTEGYDTKQEPLFTILHRDFVRPGHLAINSQGRLFVLEYAGDRVHVFSLQQRRHEFSFPAPPGFGITQLTIGPNGDLYASARRVEPEGTG